MSETEETVSEMVTAGETETPAPTPPWGSDEEFQPERAWKLIQNLREERDEWKGKFEPVSQRLREIDEAALTAEQKAARDLEEATQAASALQSENALLKAALDHGLSLDDLALLDGLPAEVMAERASALAERLKASQGPGPMPTDRPKPHLLRGGHNPSVDPERTPEDIVAEALG